MSFNAKNPLIAPSIDGIPPTPPAGARGLFATPDGWMDIDSDGTVRELGGNGGMVDQTFKPESSNAQSGKAVAEALETVEIPAKVSQLENDRGYLTEHQDISGKADKPIITSDISTAYIFEFSNTYNNEVRLSEVSSISFTFGNGEYKQDYISGLSFDSGAIPAAIDYTDSGILNWVGTDCTNVNGLSIFQPSANTHYDIVFYFNGTQFIGLVNGFIPSTGNVVSV